MKHPLLINSEGKIVHHLDVFYSRELKRILRELLEAAAKERSDG